MKRIHGVPRRPAGEIGERWVILLAAGDGSRVHGLVSDAWGANAPKQFCTLDGRESMLRWSIRRARGLVPKKRIVPVVAAKHRRWWAEDLSDLPPGNLVVQPRNRGTAAGILLPLLHVLRHDPRASVLILPSDHYVGDERRLREFMNQAVESVESRDRRIVLLGMVPDGPDSQYGWIVPGSAAELAQVEAFVEKPDLDQARTLLGRGALLNSFIIAADAKALLQLYVRVLPRLVGEFVSWRDESNGCWEALVELYERLPSTDFSREVLEHASECLSTMRASGCGWTDLGTPTRLHDYLEHHEGVLRARTA